MRRDPVRGSRWVLAFDATCGRCRHIAEVIDQAGRGRLEVLPLAADQVRRWRERALGANPAWVPTLIEVGEARVRAWTGPVIGVRLAARLGPRHTLRVLRALGELRSTQASAATGEQAPGGRDRLGRRGLFRLGTGLGVGLGLVLSGRTPAFAAPEPEKLAAARAWARENQVPRPGQYDELAAYTTEYRKTIFSDLPGTVRSALWREQLVRYREARADLSSEATTVLDEAEALLAEPRLFEEPDMALQEQLRSLESAAVDALGRGEACRLLTDLGPAKRPTSDQQPLADCGCHRGSLCNSDPCIRCNCSSSSIGCGCLWAWPCDGDYCG